MLSEYRHPYNSLTSVYISVCLPLFLSYVLQNLNIHPYASTVTLFAASDASVIVNTTDYIVDLYQQWNFTTHYWRKFVLQLDRVLILCCLLRRSPWLQFAQNTKHAEL